VACLPVPHRSLARKLDRRHLGLRQSDGKNRQKHTNGQSAGSPSIPPLYRLPRGASRTNLPVGGSSKRNPARRPVSSTIVSRLGSAAPPTLTEGAGDGPMDGKQVGDLLDKTRSGATLRIANGSSGQRSAAALDHREIHHLKPFFKTASQNFPLSRPPEPSSDLGGEAATQQSSARSSFLTREGLDGPTPRAPG